MIVAGVGLWILSSQTCDRRTDRRTMLKALVALFSLRDCVMGTLSTGELAGPRRRLARHPSETRLSPTRICSSPTEFPTESCWTQTSHHLEETLEQSQLWQLW